MVVQAERVKARWHPGETSSLRPRHGDYFEGYAILDGDESVVFFHSLSPVSSVVTVSELTDQDGNPITQEV